MSTLYKAPAHIMTYALDCAQGKAKFDGVLDTVFVNTKTWAVTVRDGKTGKDIHLDSIWDLHADVNGDRKADAIANKPLNGQPLTFQVDMLLADFKSKFKTGRVLPDAPRPAQYSGGGAASDTTTIRLDRTGDGVEDARATYVPDTSVVLVSVDQTPVKITAKPKAKPAPAKSVTPQA